MDETTDYESRGKPSPPNNILLIFILGKPLENPIEKNKNGAL
jgi:hypothetical protein